MLPIVVEGSGEFCRAGRYVIPALLDLGNWCGRGNRDEQLRPDP